jgi:hypothetical protein
LRTVHACKSSAVCPTQLARTTVQAGWGLPSLLGHVLSRPHGPPNPQPLSMSQWKRASNAVAQPERYQRGQLNLARSRRIAKCGARQRHAEGRTYTQRGASCWRSSTRLERAAGRRPRPRIVWRSYTLAPAVLRPRVHACAGDRVLPPFCWVRRQHWRAIEGQARQLDEASAFVAISASGRKRIRF